MDNLNLDVNEEVFTPRFLQTLRSNIRVSADTNVETLVRFDSDEALDAFVEQIEAGRGPQGVRIKRVAKSIRVVSLETRLDSLAALSVESDDRGIQSIDENFRVRMVLDETREVEKIEAAWAADLHGEDITVAVLDTGIDDAHPDL